jgi:hypothetical protein
MEKGDQIASLVERLKVPEIQVTSQLEMLRGNPVLSKLLSLLFDDAIDAVKNTLETISPDDLKDAQGIIKGLKRAQGIVKGQAES